jgi:rubrerythrin
VSTSTRENLTKRVAAELMANESKYAIASKAKKMDYDAVHDTVHEMAKDEARHYNIFKALLKKYFG